jgi:drug efflux transport system permease protein
MNRIRAVVRKEVIQILRDPRTLTLIIMMPLMQLVLYGYAIDTDVKHLATAVYNEDMTPLSRRLIQTLEQSAYFDIKMHVKNSEEMTRALDLGWVKAALHIPPQFAGDLLSGKRAELQLLIDGTDSNPANTAMNTSQALVTSFIEQENLSPIQILPIDYKPRLWYNPDLKSSFFMVPGLIGLLLQILIPMVTATAVVREKERGNLEQLLVSPIKPYEIMVGKLIPYVMIGLIIAVAIIGFAHLLFQLPVRGSFVTLLILTLLFLIVCLGMGLFASTMAENQQQAAQMVLLVVPPSILLSGFIFPRETMPKIIYYLGEIIPLTHYLKIVRGVILKGLGFSDLWSAILPLAAIATFVMTLSILKFRKRLT